MFVLHQRGQFFRVATQGDLSVLIPDSVENDNHLEVTFAGGKVSTWLTLGEFLELILEIRQELQRQRWNKENREPEPQKHPGNTMA